METEFTRLEGLGWKLWPKNSDGIRIRQETDPSKISFPSTAWDNSGEDAEHSGYWAQHRADNISHFLRKHDVELMWEVGAGSGNATLPVSQRGIPTIGIEPLYSGAANLAKLGCETFAGTFDELEFPPGSIECVGMFDVLEHIERPVETLTAITRSLSPGGIFIATVPAHQWLFSDFDIQSGHFRRYSRKRIESELESAGLNVLNVVWLFGLLVLPSLVLRRLPYLLGHRQQKTQRKRTKLELTSLDRALRTFLRFESKIGLLTGLSLLVVAKKIHTNFD